MDKHSIFDRKKDSRSFDKGASLNDEFHPKYPLMLVYPVIIERFP
jgi:hypothetical protein